MQLIDIKTMANQTSLSISTCRKLIRMGLPHYRIDRKILVDEDECYSWLQRFKSGSANETTEIEEIIDQALDGIGKSAA